MKPNNNFFRPLALLVLFAASVALANGQDSQKRNDRPAPSYLFVSPNTRENLTIAEAEAALKSPEESNLIQEVRDVACRLRQRLSARPAIGTWIDGAENSTMIHAESNQPSVRYAAAWP